MRILHTSDWHLGRTLHGVDLLEHQSAYLDHLVDLVSAERVDAVLVAGDVFDRAVPPVPAVELLADALARLAERTRVVLTSGNHDSAARLGFGARLFRERVNVRCRVADVGLPVAVPAADGRDGAWVYAVPYLDPDVARHRLAAPGGEDVPERSHEGVIAAAVGRVRTDLARRRAEAARRVPAVLVAHAFVVGGEPSESERDIQVGGVDSVPAGVLAAGGDLDYVALGHLHGPQRVTVPAATSAGARRAGPEVRYAGSPLAYSFSERHHRKSTALVTLDADRPASVRLVPAPVPRRLADVTGALGELLGRAFDEAAGAWVRVVVTDDVRPPDLYGQVVRRFPHALVVQHRPARGAAPAAARDVVAAHDPLEVAAQFVADVGGRCATPDERAGLRAAYEAALAAVAGA